MQSLRCLTAIAAFLEHATLSTIGLGSDVDEAMLRMLASTAAGRYYAVNDATTLQRIFTREVEIALAP
jgi:Ca-activated chloride channel family protein